MPPLPKLRTQPLAELARQLRYESPEAARMQLERTEALALEILEECGVPGSPIARRIGNKAYPLDYILFRITGLTPAQSSEGSMLIGAALLTDLASLIERLSSAAGVTLAELGSRADWLPIEDLQKRWQIGRKSIERERRRGLIARRARDTSRTPSSRTGAAVVERIMVSNRALEAFERAGGRAAAGSAVAKPRRSAITDEQRDMLIQLAAQNRILHKWSLNKCAQMLGGWQGITSQTIARALRRHEQFADQPIFGRRRVISERSRSRLERTNRKGLSPARLSGRLQRSRGTTYRIVAEERLALLRTLKLDGPVGPLFDRPDAEEVLLAPPAVRQGLGRPAPAFIGETIALADAMDAPDADSERSRAIAIALLRYRVRTFLGAAANRSSSVKSSDLYAAETRLLWASRLKAELIRSQLPVMLRTARARLGNRDPSSFPARGTRAAPTLCGPLLMQAIIDAATEAVDRFDPLRGGRLAAATTIAVNRAVGAWMHANGIPDKPDAKATKATVNCAAELMSDWTRRVDRWQMWLEPDPIVTAWTRAGASLDPSWDARAAELANIVILRYGLNGTPPRTPQSIAAELRTTPSRIIARERAAIARALANAKRLLDMRPRP